MKQFAIKIILLCTINVTIGGLTSDQLAEAVNRVCPEKIGCPHDEYGIYNEFGWSWNYTAIEKSQQSKELMEMPLSKELAMLIRSVYCCSKGRACAEKCKVPRNFEEIDLIKKFPENARELLSLNFKPLNEHREAVMQFVKDWENGLEKKGDYPAEVEEFLDVVSENKFILAKMLEERNNIRFRAFFR